jgi:methyltransferase-like protein/SAM-dependent methyltransferase
VIAALPEQRVNGNPPAGAYDEVPYSGHSYINSHPNTISTVARLFGMNPAPLSGSRVLEIGCASGENLIPMAEQLPETEFVGIDLSPRQIERGYDYIRETGLRNIELRQMNILDVGPALGRFDYILAHGIYSWVPLQVRDRLLAICRERMAANGLAYVSYNVFPGWHLLESVRNMMLYRTRKLTDPKERAGAARRFIEEMADVVKSENGDFSAFPDVFRILMQSYHAFLQQYTQRDDSNFLHDELEVVNDPLYFHQFVTHAEEHGLQYVGESEFSKMMLFDLPRTSLPMLQSLSSDRIEMEQYMDFLRNRTFRSTILCHQEVALQQQVDTADLVHYYVASNAIVEDREDLLGDSVEKFQTSMGVSISTNHPVSKVALDLMGQTWPTFYQVGELLDVSYARMAELSGGRFHPSTVTPAAREIDRNVLSTNMLKAYATSEHLVRIFYQKPPAYFDESDRPLASPWARLQARQSEQVTNAFHYRVHLDPFARFLLIRLDGTRSLEELAGEVLDGPLADGLWSVELDNSGESTPEQAAIATADAIAIAVEERVRWLRQSALLCA